MTMLSLSAKSFRSLVSLFFFLTLYPIGGRLLSDVPFLGAFLFLQIWRFKA